MLHLKKLKGCLEKQAGLSPLTAGDVLTEGAFLRWLLYHRLRGRTADSDENKYYVTSPEKIPHLAVKRN